MHTPQRLQFSLLYPSLLESPVSSSSGLSVFPDLGGPPHPGLLPKHGNKTKETETHVRQLNARRLPLAWSRMGATPFKTSGLILNMFATRLL